MELTSVLSRPGWVLIAVSAGAAAGLCARGGQLIFVTPADRTIHRAEVSLAVSHCSCVWLPFTTTNE